MEIKKTAFISSASDRGSMIVSELPQVAVVGKSNVGKSSFINFLANDSKLARTSKDPGRTRLINYFLFNESFILTDLPGYGFAKVSKQEQQKWGLLIEKYLEQETHLKHVIFLVDIRHDPGENDFIMFDYLFKNNIPFTVVATKSDKVPKSKVKNNTARIASLLKIGAENVLAVSSLEKIGKEQVLKRLEQVLFA